MKKAVVFFGVIVVIALAVLRLRHSGASVPLAATNDVTTNVPQGGVSGSPSPSRPNAMPLNRQSVATDNNTLSGNRDELTRQFAENMRSDPNYMFKIKIKFYGRVVDETGNPVAGADIGFTWNKLKSDGGFETGSAVGTSDQAGLFSLQDDAESNGLGVKVSKPGYFTLRSDRSTFDYAQPYANNFLTPDASNPVIFHLRKRQNGVPLITSQNALGSDFSIAVPQNGTTILVNLLERKTGDGALQLSQTKPDPAAWKQASEWSFQMAIPDGGFVEYQNEEFPFTAPDTGYQTAVGFDFKKDQPDWAEGISKDYYIKFGNPPVYGRLHVETQIDLNSVRLTYAINPDGTQNLEPQSP